MSRTEPMKRREPDDGMNLPDGKTCGDCIYRHHCCAVYGHIAADEVCDFLPVRFREIERKNPH